MNILIFKRGRLIKFNKKDIWLSVFRETGKHYYFITYLKYPDKFIVLECVDYEHILKLKIFFDEQIGLLDVPKGLFPNLNAIFRVLK